MKVLFLVLLVSGYALAMERAQGDCAQGGHVTVTNGINSSVRVMQSYVSPSLPSSTPTAGCTVTVFVAGTSNLASIYSDNSATPLANPFVADATGHWFFYGAGRFNVTMSGAGIGSPFTLGDIKLQDLVSVSDYGAQCNGTNDDTAALQAALTAGAGQFQLLLPAGVCMATALSIPSSTHIVGQGAGLSTIRQVGASATNNTPFIENSNQSAGNTSIYLEQFTVDGNSSGQSSTDTQGLSLVKVSGFTADHMQFVNIVANPIYGFGWNTFRVSNSTFSNYGAGSSTFPNTAAIGMDYAHATTTSSYIDVWDNTIDGSATHVGGVKLNGDSTHTFSYINVSRNYIIVGDADPTAGGSTLGIELYSNSGLGFFHYVISGNIVRGESSSSPITLNKSGTFGISSCGRGGSFGVISGNTVRWIGSFSIELCGPYADVTSNVVDTGAYIIMNSSFGQSFSNITISGNSFYNPVGLTNPSGMLTAGASVPILLYTQSGGAISQAAITGNTIQYVATAPDATVREAIHLQCNSGAGAITGTVISGNSVVGPGSAFTVYGLALEADGSCPVDGTLVSGNTFSGFANGILFGGDTNTQIIGNTYPSTGSPYLGTIDKSDIFSDVAPSSSYTTAWSSLSPSYNIILTKSGQYFQTNVGATTPNIITWNMLNGGNCSIGGILSTNSRQNTSSDSPANGWTQTSSGVFTRAGYYGLGACRFSVGFGPATGSGPNPPSDNQVLVVEDTSANTGSVTEGGVGIGSSGAGSGSRIQNVWTASTTWNPGTISAGGQATTNPTVTGCAPGYQTMASLTTITSQALQVTATAKTNAVNVVVNNPTGGGITPGSGTLHVLCMQTN